MYERFTDRARRVMDLARSEAARRRHVEVQPDDLLLGLMEEGNSVAAIVLNEFAVGVKELRQRLDGAKSTTQVCDRSWKREFARLLAGVRSDHPSPGLKRGVESAMEEARSLKHNYIGPEHLLLGLVRVHDEYIEVALKELGASAEGIRREVLNALGHDL